jgi:hypothetical protein
MLLGIELYPAAEQFDGLVLKEPYGGECAFRVSVRHLVLP